MLRQRLTGLLLLLKKNRLRLMNLIHGFMSLLKISMILWQLYLKAKIVLTCLMISDLILRMSIMQWLQTPMLRAIIRLKNL